MSMDKTPIPSTADIANLIQTHIQAEPQSIFDTFLRLFWYGFYEVTPHKFYRSAQMSPDVLKKYIQRYGIKTIINLRGKNENATWWIQEKAAVEECGVAFFNIAMGCDTMPSKENLNLLLDIYDSAQLPILVHCKGGAERSGEASAIWLLYHEGASKEVAHNQLSLRYWYFYIMHPAKRFFINEWQGQDWARHIYNPDDYLN
jgi:protein tyrosine phosphatase (PTP) superfamily phosphohydrolase (DUF442 family)